jgi:hypothetical protein
MSKYVELNLVFNEVSKLGPAIFVSNLKSYRENWKVELFVRFRDYYLDIVHFVTTMLIRHLWQLKTIASLH